MNLKSNGSWIVLGVALVASLWASEARAAKGSFEQTLSVDEPILLDVSTGSGSIIIEAGAVDRVEIVGHVKVGKSWFRRSEDNAQELLDRVLAEPPIELDGDSLRVGYLKGRGLKGNISISYEITVPATTRVKSDTGSGSMTIEGVAEVVEADSGSGSVTLNNISGSAVADTGSGSIRANGIAGAFEGDTGSGSITLTQSGPGDVRVSTGSGSIELHNIDGALHARAGSGRIRVDGRQRGTWDLDTGSGSVQIDLPDDAAFQLDAESSSGSIVIDHPVMVQGKISKRHIRGDVRGGGDLLRIDTSSGGIRVN
ncbi:MAG: hypothetical protein EX272_00160 [Chromatiales bacterium]|nr:MAG: hypothetical protein EX272_00160 [Chromatiales bacterium]